MESPKEISNVPTLDLTEAVLLRNEDGSNELIGVGTVSSQSSSSASLSSLSVNTPGNGLPVKKVTKAPKVIKASSVIVEPSLAEAAAKLCADAEGKTVVVGASNKGPSKESFASKWSDSKLKQLEFEEKKWKWDRELRESEFLFTKIKEEKRLTIEEGEFELKKQKFEHEKENNEKNIKIEYEDKAHGRKDDMKKAVMIELIRLGKGPDEINDYLAKMF